MDVGGRTERVNPWVSSIFQRLGSACHVLFGGATERRHFDLPALGGDGFDGSEVTFGGNRKAGLNDIYSEVLELVGHPDLLWQVHRAAGRLFTVTQSRIEDADSVLWHGVPPAGKQGCYGGLGQESKL